MKKIIRNIVLTIAFLLVLIVILTAIQNYFQSAYYFPRSYMNKNTDLDDFDFHMTEKEFRDEVKQNPDRYEDTMAEGGFSKYNLEKKIRISYSSNTISDNPKMTTVLIENPEFTVFGIKLGDNLREADGILKLNDFEFKDNYSPHGAYLKDKLRIRFNIDNPRMKEYIVNIFIVIDDEEMWD